MGQGAANFGRLLLFPPVRALPELLPDLTYSMLLPYVGAETALAERRRLEDGAPVTP